MRVEIQRLGHHGDGIAEGPVFVPRALPGEVVEGELAGDRMLSYRIETAAPERVAPPCRHYKGCGGCALQHARDDFVTEWKQDVVRTALRAVGLEAPIRGIHVSPSGARRRAVFSGRRTKAGAIVGFHAPASDVLREVPDCLLIRPALKTALPWLEAIVAACGSRKGEMKLSVTETLNGPDLAVEGGKPLDMEAIRRVGEIAEAGGFARIAWDGEVVVERAPPEVPLGRARVAPPPGSFLQATREGEAALVAGVRAALEGVKGPVLDLFAGCGTFSLPLAERGPVHAVEGDGAMLAALDRGWRHAAGLSAITTEARDLFRRPFRSDEMSGFEAVAIDPPRAGAEAQVRELARSQMSRIAFVSCNPVTYARDAAILAEAGFQIGWLEVVDQFRWSPHVEIVSSLTR